MTSPLLSGDAESWRERRTGVKWRLYAEDVLPLWVAEMDAAPCEPVVEAVTAALRRGDTGYPMGGELVEAGAAYAADTWSWIVDTSRASPVADVMTGVSELVRRVTDPGGPVVVSSPVYNAFFDFIDMTGPPGGRRSVDRRGPPRPRGARGRVR
jgi:cystathionine beta-lyase